MITFQPLTSEDFPLLLSWLAKPHVKEWWDDGDDTLEKVAASYGEETGTERFLIYCQVSSSEPVEPIGYVQSYWEADGGIGIDLFLGEERFLNRGIGTQVLRSFLQQMIERHDPPYFIIDPEPENARAIRCYEKVGFRHLFITSNSKIRECAFRHCSICPCLMKFVSDAAHQSQGSTIRAGTDAHPCHSHTFEFRDGRRCSVAMTPGGDRKYRQSR